MEGNKKVCLSISLDKHILTAPGHHHRCGHLWSGNRHPPSRSQRPRTRHLRDPQSRRRHSGRLSGYSMQWTPSPQPFRSLGLDLRARSRYCQNRPPLYLRRHPQGSRCLDRTKGEDRIRLPPHQPIEADGLSYGGRGEISNPYPLGKATCLY